MSKYRLFTLQDFLDKLTPLGFSLQQVTSLHKEHVFDYTIFEHYFEECLYKVQIEIFSSVSPTSNKTRLKGTDAIRCVLLLKIHSPEDKVKTVPIASSKKTLRTENALDNLVGKARSLIGLMYANKQAYIKGIEEGHVCVLRRNKVSKHLFFGTTQFPKIKYRIDVQKHPQVSFDQISI